MQANRTRAPRLNSTPIRASRPDPGAFPFRICILTLYSSVTNHSEREQPPGKPPRIEPKSSPVIVSGVSRQPNGVERPPVCHGLRWPEEIFHHGAPCFAAMEREVELRRSKNALSS